ncbi:3-oxoacyl-ACP reductase [Pseudomonas sp. S 311-6]|uniref:3-oxoacyl-ACP reductase n=1 Tax=Pseudomonas TaxID=286 RepID=UPI0020973554|nr:MULTISPECIES: 3-oxoacyl-ACP reductase [Pseudomonas]MCO7565347.1 3-oxoacyl-ACP reductase [Pseudomonas mosselii]MCO7617597.1 3-oxoacyl-ACP reductase [Pseudomonas guariconensis]MCO7639260.1 3-oxoacyl-ACP reductase [Pseudomonas sp. S 311-6]
MSDRYLGFANSNLGRRLVDALGLPRPAPLQRWQAGRLRPVEGALVLGGGPLASTLEAIAARLTTELYSFNVEGLQAPAWVAGLGPRLQAVVFDASHLSDSDELRQLREFFQPLLRSLAPCAHVVILGRAPESLDDPLASVAQRALEGFSRSLGKELRNGATAQLLYVGAGAEDQLEGALRFFLSPKSAFVSGQVLRLEACASQVEDWTRPLAGRRALVTGAARGIGAAIAETLARDGAEVTLLDVPPAQQDLDALAARLGGRALALDICASDAPAKLLDALPEGIDIVVHNAGITCDKTLANMTPEYWDAVMAVNLKAPQLLTQALHEAGALGEDARITLLASVSGIAGNRGQANYAASKAGLIGFAQSWAPKLAERGGTINAVAPGFIETHMTAAMPMALREAGRRLSSLGQGGQPQDVAEAVAWLSQPGSGAVNGQVLRVCGQALMGA